LPLWTIAFGKAARVSLKAEGTEAYEFALYPALKRFAACPTEEEGGKRSTNCVLN
jgi:hypothetical protein